MEKTLNFKKLLEAECKSAQALLRPQKELVKYYRDDIKRFPVELQKFLEALIMVKGHAWCMDVKSERKKMSKLITETLREIL